MTTTADGPTLGHLLLSGATTLSERVLAGLDVGEEAAEIKTALERAVPGLPLRPVIDGVCASLQQSLDVPISGLLVGAWDRSRQLRAAIQQTRESDKAAVLVPLRSTARTSTWW
jgi:hypothetical protein